jgi:hypothetical protein
MTQPNGSDSTARTTGPLNSPFLSGLLKKTTEAGLKRAQELKVSETEVAEWIARTFLESLQATAPMVVRSLYRLTPSMLAEHDRLRKGFERRLRLVWGAGLDRFYATYVAGMEAGELHAQAVVDEARVENDIRYEALVRLHGRSCQVVSEIYALLKSGHAAGAEARWRTLHEMAVVASLIFDGDQSLAERYLLHATISLWADAKAYEKYRIRLGLPSLDQSDIDAIEEARTQLLSRYGQSYDQPWGWASPLFTSESAANSRRHRVTFRDLEDLARLDHYRPFYQLGSHRIHAGARSMELDRVTVGEGDTSMLAGPSNAGLADVGSGAIHSFLIVSTSFLGVRATEDPEALLFMHVLTRLTDLTGAQFIECNSRLATYIEEMDTAMSRGPLSAQVLEAKRALRWWTGNARSFLRRVRWRIRRSGT